MRAPVLTNVLLPTEAEPNVWSDKNALRFEIEAHSATSNRRQDEVAGCSRARRWLRLARRHQEAPGLVTVVVGIKHLARVLHSPVPNTHPSEARWRGFTCCRRHRHTSFPAGESGASLVSLPTGACAGHRADGHRDQRRGDKGGPKRQLRSVLSFFASHAGCCFRHPKGSLYFFHRSASR